MLCVPVDTLKYHRRSTHNSVQIALCRANRYRVYAVGPVSRLQPVAWFGHERAISCHSMHHFFIQSHSVFYPLRLLCAVSVRSLFYSRIQSCNILGRYMVSDQQNWFSTVAMAPLLLELISTSKLVQLAISSVTRRWQLLCQVSIGTILFVYWCSCVIFVFFFEDLEFSVSRVVDGQSPPRNENEYFVAPRYLWKCFVFVLDSSLRTQDIGKAFGIVQSSTSDSVLLNMPTARLFIRIAISFTFWFVFQLIFLRVFPGVISDTFKDNRLRNQRTKMLRLSRCFICGLESHDFILTGTTFDQHVHKEHAPYSYVQYFVYLAEKDPTEYTGLESYVVNCILSSNVGFLPIGTCLSVQNSSLQSSAKPFRGGFDGRADNFQGRLNRIVQQQQSLEADWEYHGRFARKATSQKFAGIAEIRDEFQKRSNVLKANPFVVQ